MPRIPFPNVPALPGVPQLPRSPAFPASPPPVVGAILGVARLALAFFAGSGWGIYKTQPPTTRNAEGIEEVTSTARRVPVIVPDSFQTFEYDQLWDISKYPVAQGGFMSANKVDSPYEIVLRLAKGGTKSDRQEFIDSIEQIAGSLDLFDIFTPEKTYIGVNITRFRIARQYESGAYFFGEVDVYFEEIRTVTSEYTTTATGASTENARTPDAQPPTNLGVVQGAEQ